jgi:hypothetical protein
MNIRPDPADGASPLRIDLTRKLREGIQSRQPLPAEPEASSAAEKTQKDADAVRQARDDYRARQKERGLAQREKHQARLTNEHAASVTQARAEYADKLEKRKAATSPAPSAEPGTDTIDISPRAERLALQAADRANARDEAREARVRELRERYSEGKLESEELYRRAADRLLGE